MRSGAKTMRKVTLLLAAIALALVLVALPAQAATTFTVNATNDAPDTDTTDGVCDSNSAEEGNQCTLRAAIQEANAQGEADVINVPAGTYTLTISRGDEWWETTSTATGDLNITEALSINGAGPASTTVEGGAGFDDKIFLNHENVSTTITGLTITGGDAADSNTAGGGGIFNYGGDLKVSNTTITANRGGYGGGIYSTLGGTLTLSDSTISNNKATGAGGGIFYHSGDLKVSNTTITANEAVSGGGIYSDLGDTLTLSDSTISNNRAISLGGGIRIEGNEFLFSGREPLTVSDSTISDNTAGVEGRTVGNGGGIYASDGLLRVERSIISGNTATDGGGGIYSLSGHFTFGTTPPKTTITNSTISGNTAIDSTISGNTTRTNEGGGVYNYFGLTEIKHSTITNNSAPAGRGSGVASSDGNIARTEVFSSIISDNTGTDVDVIVGRPDDGPPPPNSFVSQGYNLIGDGTAVTGTGEITGTFNKSTDKKGVADPGLVPLRLNAPGSTKTHALKATSPAINAGAPTLSCPATDQRGFDRPQENRCDIGSFEKEVTPPSVTKVGPVEDATGIAPSTNVTATFSEAMKATSINQRTFKLYKKGSTTALTATVTYDAATKRAVLNPEANLRSGATYKAVLTTGVRDLADNALDQDPSVAGNQMKVWHFTIRR